MPRRRYYRQYVERAGLALECGTENVPPDGYYYVIHAGRVIGRFRSLRAAQSRYEEVLASLNLPQLPKNEEEIRKARARALAGAVVDSIERETFARAIAKRSKTHRTRTYG